MGCGGAAELNMTTPSSSDASRPPVKVSVAITTFDKERFIARGIASVLEQEVDFEYEIVIADDCSTDGTKAILLDYQFRFPDRIKIIQRQSNLGMVRNFLETYSECRGKYIAFLDGDDYWTSPHKLRKQVELLDREPGLALCFHRVRVVPDDAPERSGLLPADGEPIMRTLEDLLRGDCFATSSTMVRRLFEELPAWCGEMPIPDWPTFVLHAQHGGIGYLDETMAVYRLHSRSGWSSLPRLRKLPRKIDGRRLMAAALGSPYDAILAPVIAKLTDELASLQSKAVA